MINPLEILVLFGAFGALIQNLPFYQWFLNKTKLNFKPFNCTLCLTFWLTMVYCVSFFNPLYCILISSGASVLGELLDRKLNDF